VAAFVWNGWQLCRGISGRIHLESVAALPWNTQLEIATALGVSERTVFRYLMGTYA
jgi:hypothetical protein